MYLALIVVALVVVGVVFAVAMTRRRGGRARRTPHGEVQPESLMADLDDSQSAIERAAGRHGDRADDLGADRSSAHGEPDERRRPDGVFRVSVERPGPAADEVLDTLRRHCHLVEAGGGEYDARMHDHMQSGTAMSQMTYVLDRERPDWAQLVSIRPADDP